MSDSLKKVEKKNERKGLTGGNTAAIGLGTLGVGVHGGSHHILNNIEKFPSTKRALADNASAAGMKVADLLRSVKRGQKIGMGAGGLLVAGGVASALTRKKDNED